MVVLFVTCKLKNPLLQLSTLKIKISHFRCQVKLFFFGKGEIVRQPWKWKEYNIKYDIPNYISVSTFNHMFQSLTFVTYICMNQINVKNCIWRKFFYRSITGVVGYWCCWDSEVLVATTILTLERLKQIN